MKHLCCSKIFIIFLISISSLFASISDKSAIFYLGDKISYPMVGIHDYIVVDPKKTNIYTHGFSVYRDRIYATIDIETSKYTIESLYKKGFKNFYIHADKKHNNLDDIQKELNTYHAKYSDINFMMDYDLLKKHAPFSLFKAIVIYDNDLISKAKLDSFHTAGVDIIKIKFMDLDDTDLINEFIQKSKSKHIIPYISNRALDIYGKSSKVAIKREILTLIDETKVDRMLQPAHQQGGVVFEYMGYIEKLYNIQYSLPDVNHLTQYAGVVIWLNRNYDNPAELMNWVSEVMAKGIKVVFAGSFGFSADAILLNRLGLTIKDGDNTDKKTIVYQDDMIGFEIEPSLSDESLFITPKDSKAILTYKDKNGLLSTPSAITPWGGYAMNESFMSELNDENIWIIDPFKFFKKTLRLKTIPVPDVTTENGNRLLFTHIDGDGIMNYVEADPEKFSGDIVLDKIIKKFNIPHSVSIIGAEVASNGLFPEISDKLVILSKKIYAQKNVEPATHTFTHPFMWDKIVDGKLDKKYRLKPKGYTFSLDYELSGSLNYINNTMDPTHKAKSVFWSGDCAPRLDVLDYVYKHKILNINGGYTVISNAHPWLSNVSAMGLERGEYYQVYTAQQNENVYTNDWLGPFWGFKKVVQTFKLTDKPKRLKPIDVYYHFYSGSKIASVNAIKYIFNWALKQDVMPIFTSEYIKKVMDYYVVSMSTDDKKWLCRGMNDLRTLRVDGKGMGVDFKYSKGIVGMKSFNDHIYLSTNGDEKQIFELSKEDAIDTKSYLISSNAKLTKYIKGKHNVQYRFDGYVNLDLKLYVDKGCRIESIPKCHRITHHQDNIELKYNTSKAIVNVSCK